MTRLQLTRHPANRTPPQTRASPARECLLLRPLPAISPCPTSPDAHKVSPRRLKTDTGPNCQKSCPDHRLLLPLIALSAAVTSYLRWIRAKRANSELKQLVGELSLELHHFRKTALPPLHDNGTVA